MSCHSIKGPDAIEREKISIKESAEQVQSKYRASTTVSTIASTIASTIVPLYHRTTVPLYYCYTTSTTTTTIQCRSSRPYCLKFLYSLASIGYTSDHIVITITLPDN